jgi:hypothetical protein
VHRKLPLVLILCSWLLATGSQWDLLQGFAWAKMFSDNVRAMAVGDALARTFSPEGRCEICHAVSTAKQQQDDGDPTPGGKAPGETLLLFMPAPPVVIVRPDSVSFAPTEVAVLGLGRIAPPVPPPRV